jgi:polysaccharide export outer membrane protein
LGKINQLKRSFKDRKLLFGLIILILLSSCIPKRKLLYLQEQKDGKQKNEYSNLRPEKTIQPFDNLHIQVSSIDEKTANIFGSQGGSSSPTDINLVSYTVNQNGYITFPFVGEIFVEGLKLQEAREKIEKEVGEYLSNISVTVKFVNNTVAVLGEVSRPGEYIFYRDQITIFQALSLAGDFRDYGDKENVILVRELKNKIHYYSLNLTDKNIVSSEYYYIIPNDVIIVKPVNAKFRNLSLVNMPLILSTLSTLASLTLLIYTLGLIN